MEALQAVVIRFGPETAFRDTYALRMCSEPLQKKRYNATVDKSTFLNTAASARRRIAETSTICPTSWRQQATLSLREPVSSLHEGAKLPRGWRFALR